MPRTLVRGDALLRAVRKVLTAALDTLSIFHIPGRNKVRMRSNKCTWREMRPPRTKADNLHRAQPNTLTLGLEQGEEVPLLDQHTLEECGIGACQWRVFCAWIDEQCAVHECELSYFNWAEFETFRAAPSTKW